MKPADRPSLVPAAMLGLGTADAARADERFPAFTRGAETLRHRRWVPCQFTTLRTGSDSGFDL